VTSGGIAHSVAEAAVPTSVGRTKPPFGYYGAKQRIASKVIESLPPHNCWVEAFCGSAAITLAKPAAPIEVINDLDGEVTNVFEQLRTNSEALCKAVALTPYAREEFELARYGAPATNPLERARRFLVATMMSFFNADRTQFLTICSLALSVCTIPPSGFAWPLPAKYRNPRRSSHGPRSTVFGAIQ